MQNKLKAPKNQYNSFGKYSYRNAEDILEAVKPLCEEYLVTLNVTDTIKSVNERIYVVATATLFDTLSDEMICTQGWAQEPAQRKGMDLAQVTGASSSYARKYALNGLLAIDDTKDADSYDNTQSFSGAAKQRKPQAKWRASKQDWARYAKAQGEYQQASGLSKQEAWEQICSKLGNPKTISDKKKFDDFISKVSTLATATTAVAEGFGEQPMLYNKDVDF